MLKSGFPKVIYYVIFFLLCGFNLNPSADAIFAQTESRPVDSKKSIVMQPLSPHDVALQGLLGRAAESSIEGRLRSLTTWNDSTLLKIFEKQLLDTIGVDWLGEHVGKWMYTAARAAARTNDKELLDMLKETAGFLMDKQEPDGYLGVYAPSVRFTSNVRTNFDQTWDIWTHSYLILAFLEINRYWPNEKYLNTAKKIGDLLYDTFYKTGKSTAYRGSHFGLSGTVLLEPIVELYKATGDVRYLNFAEQIIQQMEDRPELQIVSRCLDGKDVQTIGDGKIYQLCWNLVGIADLYEATGNPDYLKAVQNAWKNIKEDHLTLGASPWGGIGIHHEVFNRRNYWSPYGFVETCNTMSWIQLNRDLLSITGDAQYAEIIERAAYNALLGAQYPDGEDWCYFSFPNGERHSSLYRACCRSSGALALEEIAPLIYGKMKKGIAVNIYSASQVKITLPQAGVVNIVQETDYPFGGKINVIIRPERKSIFPVFFRIPDWAENTVIRLNDEIFKKNVAGGGYVEIKRKWGEKDQVVLEFPMKLRLHKKSEREQYRGKDIYRIDWMALTRGPLLYAISGLIDGTEREEVLKLPDEEPEGMFREIQSPSGASGQAFQLTLPDRAPILFLPYYEAGGRSAGKWRLTWFQVKIF